MARWTTAALALAVVWVGTSAPAAQDKDKAARPVGVWTRSADDHKITFDIRKDDKLFVTLNQGERVVKVEATYKVGKDNQLTMKVTKVELKGVDNGPSEGQEFSFRFKVVDGTMTVSDLKGTDSEEAKNVVQGEYKRVVKKEK
ncbi:MAG TPA: hypothetical protein VFA26_11385 [Gemmataceae bacterium]|nr:hypothetical protein [Gemmataceae bacterium]